MTPRERFESLYEHSTILDGHHYDQEAEERYDDCYTQALVLLQNNHKRHKRYGENALRRRTVYD